jgi:hypothetical protein
LYSCRSGNLWAGEVPPIVPRELWLHLCSTVHTPTVCLDVTSLVVYSYGCNSGKIVQRVARKLAVHVATDGGHAARAQHRHSPPVAPVRQRHGRRPQLTPWGAPSAGPHRDQGQPGGHTGGATPPSLTRSSSRDAPTAVLLSPPCAGLATWDAYRKRLINNGLYHTRKGHTGGLRKTREVARHNEATRDRRELV